MDAFILVLLTSGSGYQHLRIRIPDLKKRTYLPLKCLFITDVIGYLDVDLFITLQGLLRIQNDRIFITKENVDAFLQRDDLDPTFRLNLENHLNIAKEYYALPKGVLKNDVELSVFSKTIAELCELSALEKKYHIRHSDDRELTSILKHSLSAESEIHK